MTKLSVHRCKQRKILLHINDQLRHIQITVFLISPFSYTWKERKSPSSTQRSKENLLSSKLPLSFNAKLVQQPVQG